jgi:hypothetical protein
LESFFLSSHADDLSFVFAKRNCLDFAPGLPDFSWQNKPKRVKIYPISQNGHKIHFTKHVKYSIVHNKYQRIPIQGPPKYAQICIFGMTIYNLANPGLHGMLIQI